MMDRARTVPRGGKRALFGHWLRAVAIGRGTVFRGVDGAGHVLSPDERGCSTFQCS